MDLTVVESHDRIAFALENAVAFEIVFALLCLGMLGAVEFDDKARAVLHEI